MLRSDSPTPTGKGIESLAFNGHGTELITEVVVPTNETVEDYLTRLEAALEPQGDFWEMELVGQMVETRNMGGVDSSDPEDVIRSSVAKEIELQFRDIELWRDDLAVQVERIDWDCFEVQNGSVLIGTLAVRFTMSADGITLWSAGANIFCEHSLEDDLEDDEDLDELPDDEVEDWWLAHGLDVWDVTDFRCRWIDIGEVELAGSGDGAYSIAEFQARPGGAL